MRQLIFRLTVFFLVILRDLLIISHHTTGPIFSYAVHSPWMRVWTLAWLWLVSRITPVTTDESINLPINQSINQSFILRYWQSPGIVFKVLIAWREDCHGIHLAEYFLSDQVLRFFSRSQAFWGLYQVSSLHSGLQLHIWGTADTID